MLCVRDVDEMNKTGWYENVAAIFKSKRFLWGMSLFNLARINAGFQRKNCTLSEAYLKCPSLKRTRIVCYTSRDKKKVRPLV